MKVRYTAEDFRDKAPAEFYEFSGFDVPEELKEERMKRLEKKPKCDGTQHCNEN